MIGNLTQFLASAFLQARIRRLQAMQRDPQAAQERLFRQLIGRSGNTAFGRDHHLRQVRTLRQFQERVPVRTYEELYPYIERTLRGEANVLWPGRTRWFAKSSGTTNDVSKFIPVTPESLHGGHFKAGKDLAAAYLHNRPESQVFKGKTFSIGGTHQVSKFNASARYGDLSAVLTENLPAFYQWRRAPRKEVALMTEWETKIEAMAREIMAQPITALMGVPTWTIVLIRRLFEQYPGPMDLRRLLPQLEVFFHGAVSFTPYRAQFREFIPHDDMWYVESYNASEGYFAFQNGFSPPENGMLLLADHGTFFEFVPLSEVGNPHPHTLGLDEVEPNCSYALVISTTGGLWRYLIGDTIRFTRTRPYELVVAGRTKHYINAFGEEVVVGNTDAAIAVACERTGARVAEYTAAPIYFRGKESGGHEWAIEFHTPPPDAQQFFQLVDAELQRLNSDYAAKRYHDLALAFPTFHIVPTGTFHQWLKQRGKLGGQNKVPRLSNDRSYLEPLLALSREQSVR
jgi:hypothetical protein